MVDGALGAVLAADGVFALTAFDAAALAEAALLVAALEAVPFAADDLAVVTLALAILFNLK